MCWRKPNDHNVDCYFCLTQIDGDTGMVEYANVISVTKPVGNKMPVDTQLPSYSAPPLREKNIDPHLILPNELDLLISGLNLSERSAEILIKTFQEWRILAPCKYINMVLDFNIILEYVYFWNLFICLFSSRFSSSQSSTSDVICSSQQTLIPQICLHSTTTTTTRNIHSHHHQQCEHLLSSPSEIPTTKKYTHSFVNISIIFLHLIYCHCFSNIKYDQKKKSN